MKSWSAPLYVKSYDLLHWLAEQVEKWPRAQRCFYGDRIRGQALALTEAISLALTFSDERSVQLRKADHALVGLRLSVRLSGDLKLLSERQQRFLVPQLEELGRMLGGWQRAELRDARRRASSPLPMPDGAHLSLDSEAPLAASGTPDGRGFQSQ